MAPTRWAEKIKRGRLKKPLTMRLAVSRIEGKDGGRSGDAPKKVRKTLWRDRENMGRYRPEFLPLGTVIGSILVRVQYAPPF